MVPDFATTMVCVTDPVNILLSKSRCHSMAILVDVALIGLDWELKSIRESAFFILDNTDATICCRGEPEWSTKGRMTSCG